MTVETQYNVVKVNELREITVAQGVDELVINDLDSSPLETKKITAQNFALSIKDYILPIATDETLGGVKIGEGLTINPITGVLSNDVLVLDDLDDVIILNAEAGQVLRYNGNQWINQAEGGFTKIIAGDGLSGGGTTGEVVLHVNAGPGLSIALDAVKVNVGAALEIIDDRINVKVSEGLTISSDSVAIVPGVGMNVSNGAINFVPRKGLIESGPGVMVDLHTGIEFENNKLVVLPGTNLEYDNNYRLSAPVAEPSVEKSIDEGNPGVVTLSSLERTLAGADNTQATTPEGVKEAIYARFAPVRPDPLKVSCSIACYPETDTTKCTVAVDNKRIVVVGLLDALTSDDKPALGTWQISWMDITDANAPYELVPDPYTDSDGSLTQGISWSYFTQDNFIITPSTGMRVIRLEVKFIDVFGMEYTAQSRDVQVVYKNAMKIVAQPTNIDLTDAGDKDVAKTTTVSVVPYDPDLPWDSSKLYYRWNVWDNEIKGTNDPDLDYDFSGFHTNTLSVTRKEDSAALLQLQCDVYYDLDPDTLPIYDIQDDAYVEFSVFEAAPQPFAEETKDVRNRFISSQNCLVLAPTERVVKEITKEVSQPQIQWRTPAPQAFKTPKNTYGSYITESRTYYTRNGRVYGSRARYRGKRN